MNYTENINKVRERVSEFKERYGRYKKAAFFVGGFLFDALMLDRIDNLKSIIQQFVYIIIVLQIIKLKTLEQGGAWQPSDRLKRWWHYNDEALNFFLGTLLNFYTLFYFVSSSLAISFIYLTIIFGLLVYNELPQRHAYVMQLKIALMSLAIFSFLFIIVTVALGFVGYTPFLIAIGIGLAIFYSLFKFFAGKNMTGLDLKKNILWPPIGVAAVLIGLYVMKILPPIPLSVQSIGIYHGVERIKNPTTGESDYNLVSTRPKWKFWQKGDQSFIAKAGDKVYCFVRIFAPANFKDKIVFRFLKSTPQGWQTSDKVINDISGGRDDGFRSWAVKSNYEPGVWRVQVETLDGHEMGRIGFTIDKE
jgi:Protein of unknown function (DUF2914)